ncbi:bifunctional protein farnesyltransferase/protein geranylgeranyltransferase [Kluyveromyces lactis]|uniref:Protein farnesyltransferase/geranylgeranyltransferase type-1 subunit alpha n=1 Tax=Kluyveromyces lactis (strain ATCC 8585 / CBS 2359 / DSM 70799 / NBRC 1267 / NRRL Y-1140 / WM37) TaxID=284590 RepID=Q6CMS8_KLULA|nr:uncharacterized protein KLLA0_E17975g [Kluyveromyces lactis]CAG99848.1 KLLA0E17975p [Kluyveromyces lactis]|eukprot:XP_454761.1 uncharacterized protein KLLA0_E17975g [Kluyveromyces lactis]
MDKCDYSDVKRIPIESGLENELCAILYTDQYKELVSLFVALLQQNELSERAMAVTAAVIETVPALYTAWNYRFEICMSLFRKEDVSAWEKELDWLDEFTLNNPKNYQIWSYRQALLSEHPSPKLVRDLPILDVMIDDDTKNYHVWSYRKWSVQFFKDWSHELDFVNKYIDRDVYNNSAWTHRAFYLKNVDHVQEEGVAEVEIQYCMDKILLAPQNVSPWNHLRFIYKSFKNNEYDSKLINFASSFIDNALETYTDQEERPISHVKSSFALELLADVYSQTDSEKSKIAYQALADTWDPIRKNYWNLKIRQLTI